MRTQIQIMQSRYLSRQSAVALFLSPSLYTFRLLICLHFSTPFTSYLLISICIYVSGERVYTYLKWIVKH